MGYKEGFESICRELVRGTAVKKERVLFSIVVCCLIAMMTGVGVFSLRQAKESEKLFYVEVFEDGHLEIANTLKVVPSMEPNDVNDIWPVYVALTWARLPRVKGSILILHSQPFLLTDNPALVGHYGKRKVYFVSWRSRDCRPAWSRRISMPDVRRWLSRATRMGR